MTINRRLRQAIYLRDHLRCRYCKRTCLLPSETWQGNPLTATLDHVVPQSEGGADTRRNLVTACEECNGRKGNLPRPVAYKPIGDIVSGELAREAARQIIAEQIANGEDQRVYRVRKPKDVSPLVAD